MMMMTIVTMMMMTTMMMMMMTMVRIPAGWFGEDKLPDNPTVEDAP